MAGRVRRLDRVRSPCPLEPQFRELMEVCGTAQQQRHAGRSPARHLLGPDHQVGPLRNHRLRYQPRYRPEVRKPRSLAALGVELTTSKTVCSVTVTVVDGSDRTDYTTFSKAAYSALGGNLDTGMLPVVLSLSKDAAAAAKKVAAVNVAASSATSAAAAAAAPSAQAPTTTAAPAPSSQVKVAVQAPTTTAVDAAASSAAAKKAYGASRRTGFPFTSNRD